MWMKLIETMSLRSVTHELGTPFFTLHSVTLFASETRSFKYNLILDTVHILNQ
jgi:hypothetical protein